MASLTGEYVSETYDSLLKVVDNNILTGTLKDITDGFGNVSALQLSTTAALINGSLTATSIIKLDGTSGQFLKADGSVDSTSYLSASGTTNYLSKFTGTSALGNSSIFDDGSGVTIDSILNLNSSAGNDKLSLLHSGYAVVNLGVTNTDVFYVYHQASGSFPIWINSAGRFLLGSTSDNGSTAKLQITGGITYQNIYNVQVASYSLLLTDQGKTIQMNVGTANNLTVPLNSSVAFPIGTQIDIIQYGAGQTTVVATGGVTIRSSGGALKLFGQYSAATLQKLGTDEWLLVGDITT